MARISLLERLLESGFQYIHQHNLVYVTCWEDPRLDRKAMALTDDDTVLVLTSAGCNAIEYALDSPKNVYAVDLNPRQNALLELKIAGIKALEFPDFFQLFGEGYSPDFEVLYQRKMRSHLSSFAQTYWDQHGTRFFSSKNPLFFHGTTGIFARIIQFYIDHIVKLRDSFDELLSVKDIQKQNKIYYEKIHPKFWGKLIHQLMNTDLILWMLGVPPQQRQQMERYLDKGVADFVEKCCREVFAELPIWDNYFWRVFIEGKYSHDCCPEYLKPDNFKKLKSGLVDRISVHTSSVTQFLEQHDSKISHFVLLDHMDWLSNYNQEALEQEWQAIVDRSAQNTRILFRSGGFKVEYVDPIQVSVDNKNYCLGDLLTYSDTLSEQLHPIDRVHTYGSFYIADLAVVG